MPFTIVRNDITQMQVDAIVNTANPKPVVGYGVDAGVHQKAGPKLLEARRKIGKIPVGSAAATPGFDLPARYVIHAVGPVWRGGLLGEKKLLRRCYDAALAQAAQLECESVAFPLISAGNHGFAKNVALQIAMGAISDFLMEHEMQIYLVVFSKDAFALSEKLFQDVSSFIDENYVLQTNLQQYGLADKCQVRESQQKLILREQMRRYQAEETAVLGETACLAPAPMAMPSQAMSLEEMLDQTDAGFSETLLKLIDATGKKDSAIYSRANISRQHFSKIRNNPFYKPTKETALAFAIALELNLEQTKDLIGRAGYALTKSSKFDVIVMYFIMQNNYNMMDINAALFAFDQSLLGGK